MPETKDFNKVRKQEGWCGVDLEHNWLWMNSFSKNVQKVRQAITSHGPAADDKSGRISKVVQHTQGRYRYASM